jgi:two-component system CheB/CheR fusion protein
VAVELRRAAEKENNVEAKAPVRAFQPGKTTGFPIVGVGSSAGGLEALGALFRGKPANTEMGFVVVSHLRPGHTSMLPELLGKATRLRVVEARDGGVRRMDTEGHNFHHGLGDGR